MTEETIQLLGWYTLLGVVAMCIAGVLISFSIQGVI